MSLHSLRRCTPRGFESLVQLIIELHYRNFLVLITFVIILFLVLKFISVLVIMTKKGYTESFREEDWTQSEERKNGTGQTGWVVVVYSERTSVTKWYRVRRSYRRSPREDSGLRTNRTYREMWHQNGTGGRTSKWWMGGEDGRSNGFPYGKGGRTVEVCCGRKREILWRDLERIRRNVSTYTRKNGNLPNRRRRKRVHREVVYKVPFRMS